MILERVSIVIFSNLCKIHDLYWKNSVSEVGTFLYTARFVQLFAIGDFLYWFSEYIAYHTWQKLDHSPANADPAS